MVSPGYLNEGRLVEVSPHQETIVQAALTPTRMLSEFQQKTAPLRQGDTSSLMHLGQMLKLDRLLVLRVQAVGPDITVFGLMVDGITGDIYQEAQKSFSTLSPLFRGEVESWLASSFRKPQYTIPKVKPDARLNPSDPGYIHLSGPREYQHSTAQAISFNFGLTLSGAIASAALSQQMRGFFKGDLKLRVQH